MWIGGVYSCGFIVFCAFLFKIAYLVVIPVCCVSSSQISETVKFLQQQDGLQVHVTKIKQRQKHWNIVHRYVQNP